MLELTGEKLEAYNIISAKYNERIAEKYIAAVDLITSEGESMLMCDTLAISLLLAISSLGQYCEQVFPDINHAPIDLRNLGYYLNQCMASLSNEFAKQKEVIIEPPSGLIF